MIFCDLVLFFLILGLSYPLTSSNEYQINFQFQTWISLYSDNQSSSYLNKSQELQSVLESAFSNSTERYNISILNLTQGPLKTPNSSETERSIIASVNIKGSASLEDSVIRIYLIKINASLMVYSSSSTPSSIYSSSDNAISRVAISSTESSNKASYSLEVTSSSVTLNSSLSPESTSAFHNNVSSTTSLNNISSNFADNNDTLNTTSLNTTLNPTYSLNFTTFSAELNSSSIMKNDSSFPTTLASITSRNENISSNFANNSISNLTTTVSETWKSTTLDSSTININYTTPSIKNISTMFSNITEYPIVLNGTVSTESNINLTNSMISTVSLTTLQNSTLSTNIISSTVSSTIVVGLLRNYSIGFNNEKWIPDYSNMTILTTKNKVTDLIIQIALALNLNQNAITIYSLRSGSIIADLGIRSDFLNEATINNRLSPINAAVVTSATPIPVTTISSTGVNSNTNSNLPPYAIALIAVFSTCIAVAIVFVATAVICRHQRLKGYGRHEVEFFEMNDGWKYGTQNPSFMGD